jgi:hypothetical protein
MRHPQGTCAACGRIQPVKKGYCRLCWCQASLEARGMHSVLPPFLERIRHHQLFFAGMKLTTRWNPRPQPETDSHPGAPLSAAVTDPPARRPVQLVLFEASRDFTRFSWPGHANLASPWLARGRQVASQLGEARGWTPKVRRIVDRALVMLLSGYRDGEVSRVPVRGHAWSSVCLLEHPETQKLALWHRGAWQVRRPGGLRRGDGEA